MRKLNSLILFYLGLLVLASSHTSFATLVEINIVDNPTGGDCETVGNWDDTNNICTLTQNVTSSHFSIDSSNITLDCDGYMIVGEQTAVDDGHSTPAITLGAGPPTHVTVKNCQIKNFCGAISFENSNNNNILNNNIEDIFSEGSDCLAGILIDDDYDLIFGNVLSNVVGFEGIHLNAVKKNGTETQIINNKFLDLDVLDIIKIDCDGTTSTAGGTLIEQNLMQDRGRSNDGIEISDEQCDDISIIKNKILKVGGQDCIQIEGSNHEVLYNLCQFTADEALEVQTTNSLFEGNTLVRSNQDEIELGTCDPSDVNGNATIEIECGSCDNEFINNKIFNDACGSGILFENSSGCEMDRNKVENNKIYGNLFHGIFVLNPDAEDTEINDNMIRNNGEWGIKDCGTDTVISGNKGKGGALGFLTTSSCPP